MNFENPKSLSAAKSRTAAHNAPLCEIKEIFPGFGIRLEKLALRLTEERGLITPRQLGPTTRTPAFLQIDTISFSISRPSPPTSRKPAETITIPFTPFSIASLIALSATLGGRIIIARSTSPGMSEMFG